MDGSTAVGARARLVDDFNANEQVFVFLLTTKVGGLGINLTGADRCPPTLLLNLLHTTHLAIISPLCLHGPTVYSYACMQSSVRHAQDGQDGHHSMVSLL